MNKYRIVTLFTFILSPLLSIPFILRGIYNREKGSAFFMALLVGVFAFLTAPCGDLARHTRIYFMYQDMSFSAFLLTLKGDFIIQTLSFSLAKAGIHYDFLRLFLTTTAFYLLIKIFNFQIEHSSRTYSRSEIWFRFIILALSFDFFTTVLGVRFGFAISLFIYAVHLWLDQGKKGKAIVSALLSCFVHFSMFYFLVFMLCMSLFKASRLTFILLIAACLVLSRTVPDQLSAYMETKELQGAGYLGNGQWGTGMQYTFNGLMFRYIRELVALPLAFLVFHHSRRAPRWSSLMLSLIALYALTSSFATISGRLIWIFYAMTVFYLLHMERCGVRFSRMTLNAIFCCAILFSGASWYARREVMAVSRYQYALLPVPVALHTHYSKTWISRRLDKEYATQ